MWAEPLLVALLWAPFVAAAPQEAALPALVEGLAAPGLDERAAARSALGVRLAPVARDAAARRAFAGEVAGLEPGVAASRALAEVLGSDDRLFALAIEFAWRTEPDLAALGRRALRDQLDRWSLSAFDVAGTLGFDPGRRALRTPTTWRDRATSPVALDPFRGGLLGAFDRLDRVGGGLAPLVVDPRLAQRPAEDLRGGRGAVRIEGTWFEVLEQLCQVHGAAFQIQGFRLPGEVLPEDGDVGDDPPPARAWIHVQPAGTLALWPERIDAPPRAGDHIVDWCLDALRPGDLARQGAAARALGVLGWPAALGWLELRWLETGDVAALEGLLAAAARGRVVPSLQRADVIASALGLVDAAGREARAAIAARDAAIADETIERTTLAARDAVRTLEGRARRFAVGLAGLDAYVLRPDGVGGPVELADVILQGFDAAPPTGRWVRLVALEGIGAENEAVAALAARALDGGVDVRSRRQALRTLLASTRPGPEGGVVAALGDPRAFFADVGPDFAGVGLELGLAGVRVRGGASDGAWVEAWSDDREMLAELVTWAALAAPEAPWAREVVRRSAALALRPRPAFGPDPLTRAARTAQGDIGEAIAGLVRGTSPALDAEARRAAERTMLRTGYASPDERAAALARAREALAAAPGDVAAAELARSWLDAAAVVADPALGEAARAALGASLGRTIRGGAESSGGTTGEVIEAVRAAVLALRAARLDAHVEPFLDGLREVALGADHPIAQVLFDADWPGDPDPAARDVELLAPPLTPIPDRPR